MDCPITRTVQDLPERFRSLFTCYPEFNRVQSAVFPDMMESNDSIVVTAPTGSGKTVLFELAIVNLINNCANTEKIKAVYVAPVKALCSERFIDWSAKFKPLGLSCIEVTGDSLEDINLQSYQVILTTPEKFDSLTRRWRENVNFVKMVKLMLIDEVHLLSDETRGPTLETIVCRMKTLKTGIRFIAVSATIFNLEDLAEWFGDGSSPARMHKFGNEVRPVALKRVVKSYPKGNQGAYLFDIQLSYKLKQVLMDYAEGKPALIFCSTRRGVVQTCQTLVEQLHFQFTPEQRAMLTDVANRIVDTKLRDFVINGCGYHHAGMTSGDRNLVQELFTQSSLPVLVATTTLAMGVNLPAHLVVIKSTYQYIAGSYCEYPETYILQMVGRAGRPQFDTTATAVIMTRDEMAGKYQNLLDCKEIMESSLHHNLAEHLNAEIVLFTITDLGVAMDWLRCTFLYQRAFKNPNFYGLNKLKIDKELEMMVLKEMNALQSAELVELVNGMDVSPTPNGRLMSHYYLSLKTFEIFQKVDVKTTVPEILMLLSSAHEFNMIQLRVTEKRLLNDLNSSKVSEIIRYPMQGKIKTREMKINCLVQAILGCLAIRDPALQQEALRIVNLMERITKCLIEYLSRKPSYCSFYNAVLVGKCLHAKLWEKSVHVARQLERIGAALGACLVSGGKTSFDILIQSHPCELERIVNRGPPLGSHLIDQARRLPQYQLTVRMDQASVLNSMVVIGIEIGNASLVLEQNTAGKRHAVIVIVGDTNNRLLHQRRVPDSTILRGGFKFSVFVKAPQPKKVLVKVVSEKWVGLDVDHELLVNFMAKDLLNDDFKETRSKVPRKRARKVDPVTLSPKILKILEEKPRKSVKKKQAEKTVELDDICFDLEPNWLDFGQLDENLMSNDHKNNDEPVNEQEQNKIWENLDQLLHDEIYGHNEIQTDNGMSENLDQDTAFTDEIPVHEVFENIPQQNDHREIEPDNVINFEYQLVSGDFQDFGFNGSKPAIKTNCDTMDSNNHLMGDSPPWRITQILDQFNDVPVNANLFDFSLHQETNKIWENFNLPMNGVSENEPVNANLSDFTLHHEANEIWENFNTPMNEISQNFGQYSDKTGMVSETELLKKIQHVAHPNIEPEQNFHFHENEPARHNDMGSINHLTKNPWQITQILEPFNAEPVSFQLFDSQTFLPLESQKRQETEQVLSEISNRTKEKFCRFPAPQPLNEIVSREFPYHPKDVLWPTFCPEEQFKENIAPKRPEFVQAAVKPLNKLKSLKDFFPLVKAVRKLTKNINDEKCFY